MCERMGMEKPTTSVLAEKAGISKGYASDILNGKRQSLGRPILIHIYRTTGWRHSTIADLTEEDMATLERIDPWSPRSEAA